MSVDLRAPFLYVLSGKHRDRRVSAIHVICQRDGAGQLKGLSHIGCTHYTSECWAIGDLEAH
jgi:hypothetical protein